MAYALLFSGQANQHPDMLPWLESVPACAPALRCMEALIGSDWRATLADPQRRGDNGFAQVLITGTALAAWAALQAVLAAGLGERAARVQALFATMAVLDDTNLVHRGGIAGLRWMQAQARGFVAAGGVQQPDWLAQARALHLAAVQRRLSPGGSADVLASACWLSAIESKQPGKFSASPALDASAFSAPVSSKE